MNKGLTFCELFAGTGGFGIGIKTAFPESHCVFASEIDPELRQLFKLNHGLDCSGDITKIDPNTIPNHDLLVGGPPCQSFSRAGHENGLDDNRGQLMCYVADILKVKQPKWFLLENVAGLLSHDNGNTWMHISKLLQNAGYFIDHRIYSPHDFNVPQDRKRIFICGARRDAGITAFNWPEKLDNCIPLSDILDKHPSDARPLSPEYIHYVNTWQRLYDACQPAMGTPTRIVLRSEEMHLDYPLPDDMKHWRKVEYMKNREFYRKYGSKIEPIRAEIETFPKHCNKMQWNGTDEPDIWKHVLRFRQSGIIVRRPYVAPTLLASTEHTVIGWEKRYLGVNECKRLMGLESLKHMPEKHNKKMKAIGNAVCSNVIENIVKSLLSSRGNAFVK